MSVALVLAEDDEVHETKLPVSPISRCCTNTEDRLMSLLGYNLGVEHVVKA